MAGGRSRRGALSTRSATTSASRASPRRPAAQRSSSRSGSVTAGSTSAGEAREAPRMRRIATRRSWMPSAPLRGRRPRPSRGPAAARRAARLQQGRGGRHPHCLPQPARPRLAGPVKLDPLPLAAGNVESKRWHGSPLPRVDAAAARRRPCSTRRPEPEPRHRSGGGGPHRAAPGAAPRVVGLVALVVIVASSAVRVDPPSGTARPRPARRRRSVRRGIERQAEQEAAGPADGTLAHAAIAPSLVLITTHSPRRAGSGRAAERGCRRQRRRHRNDRPARRRRRRVDHDLLQRRHQSPATRESPRRATSPPCARTGCPTPSCRRCSVEGCRSALRSSPSATRSGWTDSFSAGVVSALDRTVTSRATASSSTSSSSTRRSTRATPAARCSTPGAGRRHRHRAGEPDRSEPLRRHRLRSAHHHGGRRAPALPPH